MTTPSSAIPITFPLCRPVVPEAAQLEIRTKLVQTARIVNSNSNNDGNDDRNRKRRRLSAEEDTKSGGGSSTGSTGKHSSSNEKGCGSGKGVEKGGGRKLSVRSYVVAGINEVTKGLERGELGLVMVCRSVQPALLTDHLLLQAHRGKVPVCAMYDLSPLLGRIMSIKTATAVGFKKPSSKGGGGGSSGGSSGGSGDAGSSGASAGPTEDDVRAATKEMFEYVAARYGRRRHLFYF